KLGENEFDARKTYGKSMQIHELMDEILKDCLFHEESDGGVTFSGGEPLFQPDALLELLKKCKIHGIHTTVDTCGYAPWLNYEKIIPFTDLFLYDLKLLDPEKHLKFTGVKNELIIENLQKLLDRNVNVELRIPVIPGVNDSREEIQKFIDLLRNNIKNALKIHLLPYHNIADNKYQKLNMENRMENIEKVNGLNIDSFKQELESAGFAVGIGG
ncbi:MAG: glycyl-radical enzyme activating protein, partial [Cyclobacteriaceae bacterium]|nr:glycyl-radical enzyme activating protein [Cyclobacteriaceae bacterium]